MFRGIACLFSTVKGTFSPHLQNAYTEDRLAYFSTRLIGHLPIGIVGLNSAIASGNDEDQGKIIIGDRPVIDVCEQVRAADVRLLVAVVHHPPLWLADFDQRTFDSRLLPLCDVLHRGHLHEHAVSPTVTLRRTNCLVISAGAGFVWRQFNNSYSLISVDIPESVCAIVNFSYDSHSGSYSALDSQFHPIRFRGDIPGTASDIAHAIHDLDAATEHLAPYLTALVQMKVAEIPLPINEIVPDVVETENGGSSGPSGVARTIFEQERRNRHEEKVHKTM